VPKKILTTIRRYFIAGLLLWLPIWVTLLVVNFLIDLTQVSLKLLPKPYRPDSLFGIHIPGAGLIFSIIVLLVTGMLITNFLGNRLLAVWESFLARIPFIRAIYSSVKQVLQRLLSREEQAFRKVVLIRYPHPGTWTIAFQAGDATSEITEHLNEELITVYVPTTPNPTSGFLLMLPRKDVIELKMKVDQALRYVVSLGVMQPDVTLVKK
jgi:uncharacterized membrane protein